MEIRNLRPFAVIQPEIGEVPPGETVEVPNDLGSELCKQHENWERVKSKQSKSSVKES